MDWVYGQAIGFLGNFFALMGNMGVELFELEWVSAIILFFSRLAWALFTVSVVVCAFECGIEYSAGRGNLQQCGMNIIKGFLAVSLFTVVPVRLYALSVSLQGTFSAGLTGYGRSIGEVGQDIITELSEIQTLSDVINSSHFGLGIHPERRYFFQSPSVRGDGMYSMEWIIPTFRKFLQTAGISGYGEIRPRLYDLRHTFATHRLYQWVKEGKDINACLAYLSEYMGHSNLESTAYYIHLLPTLYTDLPELHLDSSFEMEADLCD